MENILGQTQNLSQPNFLITSAKIFKDCFACRIVSAADHHYPRNIQRLFRRQKCLSCKSSISQKNSNTFSPAKASQPQTAIIQQAAAATSSSNQQQQPAAATGSSKQQQQQSSINQQQQPATTQHPAATTGTQAATSIHPTSICTTNASLC